MKKKSFKELWDLVEMPVFVMIAWSLISLSVSLDNYIGVIATGILGWIITVGVFMYIGYVAVQQKATIGFSAKLGAIAGAIIGFVSALLSVIWFYVFPARFIGVISQMIASGVTEEMARTMLTIGLFVGLISGPLITAGIGALIALAGWWLIKKIIPQK